MLVIKPNPDATTMSVSHLTPSTISFRRDPETVTFHYDRRPPPSKRYRMKRARTHTRVVNRMIAYFRKLGWRGDALTVGVRRAIEAWYEPWDPDEYVPYVPGERG